MLSDNDIKEFEQLRVNFKKVNAEYKVEKSQNEYNKKKLEQCDTLFKEILVVQTKNERIIERITAENLRLTALVNKLQAKNAELERDLNAEKLVNLLCSETLEYPSSDENLD